VTIIASVKVRDGLILGTDSMTQISGFTEQGPQLLKSYSNARKLFPIGKTPIGVMTYGLGNIGSRSIEGLVLEFSRQSEARTVGDTARGLFEHIGAQYDALLGEVPREQRPVLGFYVAGYSDGQPLPEEWEFVLPRDEQPFQARGPEEFGASWRGIDAPMTRVLKGFDPYAIPARLTEQGLNEEQIDAVLRSEGLETTILIDGMPKLFAASVSITLPWRLGSRFCSR
jgi:hypothetical protein